MIQNKESVPAAPANTLNHSSAKFLFFSGSNSSQSINQQLITALAGTMDERTITLIDLRDYLLPMYSHEEEAIGIPTATHRLLALIDEHDVLVISVPEHNHGMPAFFKNTLDWMSRARSDYRIFKGKEVILLSTSPGRSGKAVIQHAQTVFEALGATVSGTAVLGEFDKHTIRVNEQIRITNTVFLSEFKALLQPACKTAN